LFGLSDLVDGVSEDEELSFGGVADVGRGDITAANAAVDVEERDSGADVITYGGVYGVVAAFFDDGGWFWTSVEQVESTHHSEKRASPANLRMSPL